MIVLITRTRLQMAENFLTADFSVIKLSANIYSTMEILRFLKTVALFTSPVLNNLPQQQRQKYSSILTHFEDGIFHRSTRMQKNNHFVFLPKARATARGAKESSAQFPTAKSCFCPPPPHLKNK